MADKFYAVTRIKAGDREEDGSQDGKYVPHAFEPNEEVTGLSSAVMKELWGAGALTRTAPEEDSDTSEDEGPGDVAPSKPRKTAASAASTGRSES
jgi:hypothetical protein